LDASEALGGHARQEFQELRAGLGGEASEVQPLDLALERLDVVGVAMAEAAHRDARHEIEVLVAVLVDQRAALAPRHREAGVLGEALVAGGDVAALALDDGLRSWSALAPRAHRSSWGPRHGPQTPNARTRPGKAVACLRADMRCLIGPLA